MKVGTDINSFCLFCRTGSEKNIAQAIQQSYPEIIALAPVKLLPEKRQNIWTNREVVLLPGYVFVYLAGDLPGSTAAMPNTLTGGCDTAAVLSPRAY